jgi:hypothetical protein
MRKLLIYISEKEKFDVDTMVRTISSMRGVSDARRGGFIGSVFQCEYTDNGRNTIIRVSDDAKVITADGLGDESLAFAIELQRLSSVPLRAFDIDYTFDVALNIFASVSELKKAIVKR